METKMDRKMNNQPAALLDDLTLREAVIQMTFGGLRRKSNPYRKVTVRPVLVGGALRYQLEYHYEKKVTHENLPREEFLLVCQDLIREVFKQLNVFAEDGDYQILASKPEQPRILRSAPSKKPLPLSHNQEKQYLIPEGAPCDFLIRLGVMTKDGQVIPRHYGKFRQINRFLEIVDDVYEQLPKASDQTIRIIDFGCGKAYLTFALYYYLHRVKQRNVEIVGLDLKEDVIEFCNQVARDLGYGQLKFQMGDIAEYDSSARAHMVVTLHACDTATDFALIKAVGWNASVILSVPCCQHELFSQMKDQLHQPIFKHGILKERVSAILTDGLRALKLEEHGYDVSLIEFTSLEHTAKNIMIRAVRPAGVPSAAKQKRMKKAGEDYSALKEYWHVLPTIDQL